MSPTAQLRRLWRAARAVDTIPARLDALERRRSAAQATLAAALYAGPVAVPGYRITAGPDGAPTVTIHDIPADQLALWRELAGGTDA